MYVPELPKGYFFRVTKGSVEVSYGFPFYQNATVAIRKSHLLWSTLEESVEIDITAERHPTRQEIFDAMTTAVNRMAAKKRKREMGKNIYGDYPPLTLKDTK